jgi:hypothetical protein
MALHEEQDHRSLMLNTEAIKRMQADPALIDSALGILERWAAMEWRNKNQIPLFVEWQRILHERDWDVALTTGDLGNHLRKFSPCACTLPDDIRIEILRRCRDGLV